LQTRKYHPLWSGPKCSSKGPLKNFNPQIAKGKSEKPYPKEILEIQPLTAIGKHYTLEHFANSNIPSLLVGAKMPSPGATEKFQSPDCKGQIRKIIPQGNSGDPIPDSNGKTLYPGALCKLENTIPFGRGQNASPGPIEKIRFPDCKGQIRKTIPQGNSRSSPGQQLENIIPWSKLQTRTYHPFWSGQKC
jgi:hypothetical protein